MPHRMCPSLLACVVVASPVVGGETYAIRLKIPAVGEVVRIEKEETRATRTTIYDALGRKVQEQLERQVETFVYRETLLKQSADGKPALIRRHYEKAQTKTGKTSRNLAFHGLDVFVRNEGAKFIFYSDDAQPIPGADAALLDREFNGRDEKFRLEHLLPAKRVAVGAEWPVDMDGAVKDFSRTGRFAVDASSATGRGHLQTTTPSGGPQFGQILYRMEIPIVEMAVAGPTRFRAVSGSKATFELTLDLCIDGTRPDATIVGSSEVKATINLVQPGGASGQLSFSHNCDSREVRKPLATK
jgi:hypothetical protein